MSIQAMIFDLDNTLYPASSGLIGQVEQRIHEFVIHHLGLDETAAQAMCKHYYATYGTTLRGLQTHHPHVEPEAYLDYIHNVGIEQCLEPQPELAAALAQLPVRKIIWTNSVTEYAERVLDRLAIRDQFELLLDVRYFNLHGKPDPAAYTHVLELLGVPGHAAIMVEDSLLNLPPAKTLGMTTILVAEEGGHTGSADYVVPHVMAALEVAAQLLATAESPTPHNPA